MGGHVRRERLLSSFVDAVLAAVPLGVRNDRHGRPVTERTREHGQVLYEHRLKKGRRLSRIVVLGDDAAPVTPELLAALPRGEHEIFVATRERMTAALA